MLWLMRLASYRGMLLLAGLCMLYILSPIDLLPDVVPWLGRVDDLGALVGTYWLLRRLQSLMTAAPTFRTRRDSRENASGGTQQQAETAQAEATAFDPWEVLHLQPGASQAEIHAAYKVLLKKYHPDRVAHLGEEFQALAHQKMLGIQQAYAILKQP
jgi:hypothetical protein